MNNEKLNASSVDERLAAARAIGRNCKPGGLPTDEVNNHVHSTYSFSPYAPAEIPAKAREAGLGTVGIMDHDSISGAAEFLDAAKAVGIAATAGCEVRVNMDGTLVEGRKTNNPDELNVSYIALHGIPRSQFKTVEEFLKPVHEARINRDRREVDQLNVILQERGAPTLDFNKDVLSISEAERGGSVTERHILYAVSLKLINAFGKGERLIGFVEERMQIPIPGKLKEVLLDLDNPHYAYDLLGVFKSALVPLFFIPSEKDECIHCRDAVAFANSIGAIPAYAYLGDVGKSPTGDKKAEKFEDDVLDELVPELKKIGFKAITYMPPRNTEEQMTRLQKLCKENELMEISGVDINSSRQSFNCPVLLEPEFRHLADAAYALIAHEKLASEIPTLGLFHPENPKMFQTLEERIAYYAEIGRKMDHTKPEEVIRLI